MAGAALRGSYVRQALILLAVVFLTVIVAHAGISRVLTPWAHASPGHGGLVGYWSGEMVFQPGDTRQVVLYVKKFLTLRDILIHGRGDTSGPTPDIEIAAKVCGPKGATRYHGAGNVANRKGSRFTFGLAPEGGAPGRHPSEFEGAWNGADRLEVSARLYTQGPHAATGEASIAARPDGASRAGVISFALRRATNEAFDAACATS
jgi:hypothetical protein